MATSIQDIRGWISRGKTMGATHLIVVCDTFDHDDYPVFVKRGEDPRKKYEEYCNKEMQRVMEVYALHLDIESQLQEYRSFHFEVPEE